MFNIKDSYITPIILSYVDKYIKNIRLEDTQLSLWGGEAVFHNLSLRLDVLEQELALPFSFVSGQIHELAITVPWTKLHAEPIKVTINTIECVLKLKTDATTNVDSASTSSSGSREARKKVKRPEVESPPGYVQSLVNKIVSNVTIECNNLILKYVEEDMVLSLNVRSLLLQSANEKWQPAFTELSAGQLILRKLVTLHDLTVCLDRRNASGKIEFYEEPLLYRCSLELHLSRTYGNLASSRANEMRIDVRCGRMDFSVSDQQLPMLLRVLRLALALYLGELKEPPGGRLADTQSRDEEDESTETTLGEESGDSWVGWAWSFVPSILPNLLDEEEWNSEQQTNCSGHKLLLGFFVDQLSMVFKASESSSDRSYYGPKKIKFIPMVVLEVQGCYMESMVAGMKAVGVTLGASQMVVRPVGETCACGVADVPLANTSHPTVFVSVGNQCNNYLKGSLFDLECDNTEKNETLSWDDHLASVTEGVLLDRTPAFAIDYRYMLDIPDDLTPEQLSELGSDLEYSNLTERALCRFVLGPMQLHICSGLIHRLQQVMEAASLYNYPPYSDPIIEPNREDLPPLTQEDVTALESSMPLRAYQLTVFKPIIHIYLADHPPYNPSSLQGKRRVKVGKYLTAKSLNSLPCLSIECQCLDATHVKPMYPRRLLTTACQLTTPSEDMFTNCHRHTSVKLLGLGCHLVVKQQHMTVIIPSHIALHWKHLLNSKLWSRHDLALSDISIDADNITATATKAQLLIITQIIDSCFFSSREFQGNASVYEECCTLKSLPYLEVSIEGFSWQRVLSSSTATHRVVVKSARVFALRPLDSASTEQVLILSSCDSQQPIEATEPMLTFTLQYPVSQNLSAAVLPSLMIVKLQSVEVCIDPLLINWLSFSIPKHTFKTDSPPPPSSWTEPASTSKLPRRKSGSLESRSRTATAPQESVHSFEGPRNSENDNVLPTLALPIPNVTQQKQETPWWKSKLLKWYTEWCSALACIEIAPTTVYIPKDSLSSLGAESIAETLLKSASSSEVLVIKLPLVTLKSSNQRQGLHVLMAKLPITLPPSIWRPDKETFPWSLTMNGLNCYTVIQGLKRIIVHPISANCTIGISSKLEQDIVTSVGFCVHIDTPLLRLAISSEQVLLLITMLDRFVALISNNKNDNSKASQHHIEIQPSPTPPPTITAPSVHQQPQSVGSISEPSTQPWLSNQGAGENEESNVGSETSVKITVWLQWTLARLLFSLYATNGDSVTPNLKLTCDLEDMMTSVDVQQVYLKVKSKVATASVLHFCRDSEESEWQAGQHLGLIVRCNDDMLARSTTPVMTASSPGSNTAQASARGLLDVTFTRAQSRNVHRRWAQQVAARNSSEDASTTPSVEICQAPRFISEIVIKLCPVDVLLSAPVFNNFLPVFEPILSMNQSSSTSSLSLGMQINNNTLPLLYLDTKDIRVFLPISSSSRNAPDFCITQVDSINLAPHVFNPLSRVYVRPDIYHMAQQANILSVPGSEVEDRQYQLDIRKFCIQTGIWLEIEKFLQSENQTAGGELNPLSENPAVEWNKLALGKESLRHAEISLLPLVHRFDVSLMAAPAIVYQQPGVTREEYQDVLVCGHSAEVNATSDIELSVSMDQMTLLSHLFAEWLQLLTSVTKVLSQNSSQQLQDTLVPVQPDSGIDDTSSICSPPLRKISKIRQLEFIPTEVLVTASKITLILYVTKEVLSDGCNKERKANKVKRKSSLFDSNEELPSDQGYEASEESSVENIAQSQLSVQPLMYVLISQPHSVLACHSLKQRVEVSCFDLAVRTSSDTFILRNSCSTKQIPRLDRFAISLLETKGGDPHHKTGIPPSLLTTTWTNFLSNSGGQLRLDIGRPLHIHCGINGWHSLLHLQACLEKCLQPLQNPMFSKSIPNQTESEQEQSVLAKFWGIPSISMTTQQVVLTANLGNQDANELAVSVGKISSTISSRTSVVKGVGTIKSQIEVTSLMLRLSHKGRHRILVHPWSFTSDTILSWESWLSDPNTPLLQTSLNCDCISIDIGYDQIQCLYAFQQHTNAMLQKYCVQNDKPMKTSQISPSHTQGEHYRDDLRAGAFQFIDNGSNQDIPLPYQVLFNQNPPSMAWRYPQPRILTRADIFPVPFISAGLPKQDGDQVACILQYWSECQSRYITYCHFNLSESQMSRLELPAATDKQRAVTSSAWRVLLHPHSEDEDEDRGYTRVSVPPRALAACMRVDSYFCPSLVPPLQISLSVATLQINSICQLANLSVNLPKPLSQYSYDGLMPESLPLLSIIFETSNVCMSRWSCGTLLNEYETKLKCESLDMASLTKINLIESFRVEGKVFSSQESSERILELSMMSQPIRIRFGSAAGHTLATTLQLWRQSIDSHYFNIVPSRYVICNDLSESIRFRQCDTGENILLASRQCHMYAWKSTCQKQLIQIALAESGWEWSKTLSTDDDSTEILYFENCQRKVGIIWKVKSISSTQKMIVISGQLVVCNLLSEALELQVTTAKEDVTEIIASHNEIFTVAGNTTPASLLLEQAKKLVLKLRFQSLSGAWSGEIPLAVNTAVSVPWLVKIPLQEKGQFLSIWCRIFIQDISKGCKILVILSPLYCVRSLLPTSMNLAISTPGLQVQMSLTVEGKGKQHQLYCPGTVEHSHQVSFLPESATEPVSTETISVPLSYAMPQQPTNLVLRGDSIDVDEICAEAQNTSPKVWPYLDPELCDVEWSECAHPATQLQVSYELLGPHYSTLLLQLRPWALLVNILDECLHLESSDWEQPCKLPSKGVIVPPKIEGTFQLRIGVSHTSLSPPLQLACEEWNGSFYMPRISGVVPLRGSIHTTVTCSDGTLQLVTLSSRVVSEENNLRVLSVQPTVLLSTTLTADSIAPLSMLGICVPVEEKLLPLPQVPAKLKLTKPNTTQPLTCWHLLNSTHKYDSPILPPDLAFYLLLQDNRQDSTGWCCPLAIPLPGAMDGCASRQSFALGNLALVLTTHFRGGQVYAIISKEQQPQLIIHNSCSFPLILSQANPGMEQNPSLNSSVIECEHLAWQCQVESSCSKPYTMPAVQQAFPELQPLSTLPALLLAIPKSFKHPQTAVWSEPVSVSCQGSSEQFVRIPGHGDVRIRMTPACGGTTSVHIECVSRIEISAKEIRARLQPSSQQNQEISMIAQIENSKLVQEQFTYQENAMAARDIQEKHSNIQLADTTAKPHTFITVYSASIQVTLTADSSRTSSELLLLTLDDVCISMRPLHQRRECRELAISIGDVQLDNQMFHHGGYDFPVILMRQDIVTQKSSLRKLAIEQVMERVRKHAILNTCIVQEISSNAAPVLQSVNVVIKPLNVYIEDTLLMQLSKIAQNISPSQLILLPSTSPSLNSSVPVDVLWEAQQTAIPLQMQSLVIAPLSVMVSLHTSLKVFIALDRSPLLFSAFERHRVCTTSYRLGHALTRHYLSGALFRAGWVVGSLELLGSPGGFALTVGSGLRDFVCLPYLGILQGPWGFLTGVTHGSASLMKHVTAGTLSSITNLASSVARNLDRCSLDREHVERAEEARRQRPQGVGQGILQGLSSLGISLLGAVSGIAHHPLQAIVHQNSGSLHLSGLVAGVGLGLVGAITKPLSGAAELVALTGQGLLHGAGWSSLPQTRHIPVLEECSSRSASSLRYSWKVLPPGEGPVLLAVEVTAVSPGGQYEAATLVLSPQLLTVVATNCDQVRSVIPTSQLKVVQESADPTLLCLCMDQFRSSPENQESPHARVEEYVRHTGVVFLSPETTATADTSDIFSCSSTGSMNSNCLDINPGMLRFHVNPQCRDHLQNVIMLTQRQAQGRGFSTL